MAPLFKPNLSLLTFLAISFFGFGAQAQCIKVVVEAPTPVVDQSLSRKALASGNIRLPNWAAKRFDAIDARFEGEIDITYSDLHGSANPAACGTNQPFVMIMVIKKSFLMLARELDPAGCWFKVVRAHEYKHYEAMANAMKSAAPRIESAVESVIAKYAGSGDTQQAVYAVLEAEINHMYEVIDRANEHIDSLEEIKPEYAACDDHSGR